MEQIHHIRLSGHSGAFPVKADAHDRLLNYLGDARAALSGDPDGDETVRDLEASVGERLRSLADALGSPVDDTQMTQILSETGSVERPHPVADPRRPRGPWCRIDEGKWFGGICVGIAASGDLRLDWVRTIAILLMLVSVGMIGLAYLALLLLLPRVTTVAEYQRLRAAPKPTA